MSSVSGVGWAHSGWKRGKWAIFGCLRGKNMFSCLSTSSPVCGSRGWREREENGLESPNQGCCWDLRGKSYPRALCGVGIPLSTDGADAVQKTSHL